MIQRDGSTGGGNEAELRHQHQSIMDLFAIGVVKINRSSRKTSRTVLSRQDYQNLWIGWASSVPGDPDVYESQWLLVLPISRSGSVSAPDTLVRNLRPTGCYFADNFSLRNIR